MDTKICAKRGNGPFSGRFSGYICLCPFCLCLVVSCVGVAHVKVTVCIYKGEKIHFSSTCLSLFLGHYSTRLHWTWHPSVIFHRLHPKGTSSSFWEKAVCIKSTFADRKMLLTTVFQGELLLKSKAATYHSLRERESSKLKFNENARLVKTLFRQALLVGTGFSLSLQAPLFYLYLKILYRSY